MPKFFRILLLFLAFSNPLAAQEGNAEGWLGSDVFLAGDSVAHTSAGADDIFMAGDGLSVNAPISGTAILAGRTIDVRDDVGGDVFAAGMELSLSSQIAGDASVAGYRIDVTGPIGGDLRAAAETVTVANSVGGYAALTGERVEINGAISGDVVIAARVVDFGSQAVVGGTLTLYEENPGTLNVPASVAPENRIQRLKATAEDFEDLPSFTKIFDWRAAVWAFAKGVIVVALVAAAVAAIAPERMATLRQSILAAPFRSLWIGFLTQSVAIGAMVLLAMTLIGLIVVPFVAVLAILGGFIGYVIAAYALGVGLMLAIGRAAPDSIGERAIAAGVGALLAGAFALIPWIGGLFVLAAVLAGLGALAQMVFRPAFFAGSPAG